MADTDSVRRLRILIRIMFGWAALIVLRLIMLQVVGHDEYQRIAQQQHEKQREVPAPRGSILDRDGHVLAKSMPVESVIINPLKISDAPVAAELLARTLHLDEKELLGKILREKARERGFMYVKRRVSPDESNALRSYNVGDWLEFEPDSRRFYPAGQIGSHVVGTVDFEEKGNAGIELGLDEDLEGRPGEETRFEDVKQRAFARHVANEPQPGKDIYLTIDSRIQYVAEQELAKAATNAHATSGAVVVMRPESGEILALTSWPTYNPNDVPVPGHPLTGRNNIAVTTPYEPGSVFKVITVSAALETTKMTPETIINCNHGTLKLPGRVVHEAHGGYGALSIADVLAKSSNIGAIQIATRMGQDNLNEYVRKFGFGKKTGLPLPGESAGVVRPFKHWGSTSYASIAMGHEVNVTAVQLARACSVIANGGLLVTPKLVLKRQEPGQAPEPEEQTRPVRIIKPETAITMRQMMEGVVLHGTGKGARLKGYTSGGKTGTAQIFDVEHHSYTHKYNGSFMGFAPVQNPAIVIVATLNGTAGSSGYGGAVAAPVFREVATAALRFLDVPKDLPDDIPEPKDEKPTDVYDLAIAGLDPDAEAEMASSIAEPLVQGAQQQPLPTTNLLHSPDQRPFLQASAQVTGPIVPNFQGKTKRDVMQEASAKGLLVEASGRGIARAQLPPPGTPLPPGESIRVLFRP